MKHAITWANKIKPVLEISEQVDLDVAVKVGPREEDWELVRREMVFTNETAAKKYMFLRKLKKGE